MENVFDHIDNLIGKYLAGETSAEESAFVERWKDENESNRKRFRQIQVIFERAAAVKELHTFDVDAAWEKMRARLENRNRRKVIKMPETSGSFGLFWRIAASVVIVITAGWVAYDYFRPATINHVDVVAQQETKAAILPEGSEVFLNKETRLAYAYNRETDEHIIKLEGEAYFNIHHEESKNLIVDVGGVLIRDIGTAFNVKGYPGADTIEVVVEEGVVMFYTEKQPGLQLAAGSKGLYRRSTGVFSTGLPDVNVTAYKTRTFIFNNADLFEVVQTLNRVYDKKIRVSPSLKSCRLTVVFENEAVDEVAIVIAETLGLTLVAGENEILLEGPGCGQ